MPDNCGRYFYTLCFGDPWSIWLVTPHGTRFGVFHFVLPGKKMAFAALGLPGYSVQPPQLPSTGWKQKATAECLIVRFLNERGLAMIILHKQSQRKTVRKTIVDSRASIQWLSPFPLIDDAHGASTSWAMMNLPWCTLRKPSLSCVVIWKSCPKAGQNTLSYSWKTHG